jgi:hypothetical protein
LERGLERGFYWNADDADDADFIGTRMTLMTRILKIACGNFVINRS